MLMEIKISQYLNYSKENAFFVLFKTLTSMLTGEEVRGCRYSGWSKWPLCAVNILMIRTGSLLAWRKGSAGDGQDVGAETDGPVRCDSPLASSALRPGDWLRKSGSDPLGESLIWNEARKSSAACDERTQR